MTKTPEQIIKARAVTYSRYSTAGQSEASVEDQQRILARTAAAAGYCIVAQYEDRGISGGTAQRPGYQAMLAAARGGKFEVLLTEDISRLWRSRAEFGPRSAELEDLGIHMVTAAGDSTMRDGWGLVIGMKQAIAEAYRKDVSYRTRRGLEGLALAGKSTGGRCYGYRGATVDPQEACQVRVIFARALAGLSLGRIASSLEAEGAPNPRGAQGWSRATLARILANRRYLGEVVWGARETVGGARDSKLKRRVLRAAGALVERQEAALAIVPLEVFTAAQKRFSNKA